MADFCTSTNDNQQLLSLLPPLPSIQRLVTLIMQKVAEIRNKYLNKIINLLNDLEVCPPPQQLEKIINIRNNIVDQLSKVYTSVDRIGSSVSGASTLVNLIISIIKLTSSISRSVTAGSIFLPLPVPGVVSSGISAAQGEIEKLKFKGDGAQKLVPIQNGLISANITIQLFANALKDFICQLEKLDISLTGCIEESSEPSLQNKIKPLDPEIVEFVEQVLQANESSLIETTYRGFTFEIEEVPFNPRINRKRANALNKDNIVLLSSELSFTQEPSVLIEELKFVIDRDNLRAD
jgi:hypothetical protein